MRRIFFWFILLGFMGAGLWSAYRTYIVLLPRLQAEHTIVCMGDSLTSDTYPSRLKIKLMKAGFKNVRVVNLGKDGHTSGEYLKFLKRDQDWLLFNPDWVLLQLGTNDVRIDADGVSTAEFERNMEMIVDLLKDVYGKSPSSRAKIALATIPRVFEGQLFNEKSLKRVSEEINPAIRLLSRRLGLELVDNYQLFVDHPEELRSVHPTQKGYELIAENWFKFLIDKAPFDDKR